MFICRLYLQRILEARHSRATTFLTRAPPAIMSSSSDPERDHALSEYKRKLIESREWEAKLKALRQEIKGLQHNYEVSEDNIKALQSVGQIIGEVLKQLDDERCTSASFRRYLNPSHMGQHTNMPKSSSKPPAGLATSSAAGTRSRKPR